VDKLLQFIVDDLAVADASELAVLMIAFIVSTGLCEVSHFQA